MRKRLIVVITCICVLAIVPGRFTVPVLAEGSVILPPAVMPVLYLSGTDYNIGYQYGRQAAYYIRIVKDTLWAQVLIQYKNDRAKVTSMLSRYEDVIARLTPEMVQIMRGISDGAAVSYEDVLLINCHIELLWDYPVEACTCISAWGSATKAHKTITGANFDYPHVPFAYRVILIVYPEGRNSYISTACAGMMGNNFFMNDKGFVNLSNHGEHARDLDRGYGLPAFIIAPYTAMKCDNTAQAEALLMALPRAEGIQRHYVDVKGSACVVESTAAIAKVRKPGDFGEKDYLITTNHWIIPQMGIAKVAQPRPGTSEYRYMTAEKYLKEKHGSLDVGSFMNILSSEEYWDGNRWHRDAEWSGKTINAHYQDRMPSKLAHSAMGTLASQIGVPGESIVYIRNGDADGNWGTGAPFLTGEFVKLTLEADPGSVTATAAKSANHNLWLAGQALKEPANPVLENRLSQAKVFYWEGISSQVKGTLADLAGDKDGALELYGRATTDFCKAQVCAIEVVHKGNLSNVAD